ncbi:hypothetical protein CXG81DRAFT_1147, partial [Caulochytrium protostelioides]
LPHKEANLLKNVITHYDAKEYAKALKLADQVLKKFPTNGMTLALKGLCLAYLHPARRAEAHRLVAAGLKHDPYTHITWHISGLLHREDKRYAEAITCYEEALRIEPLSMGMLRDLSFMQIQERQLEGFCATRQVMLARRPDVAVHFMGAALGHYLVKQYAQAADVLAKLEEALPTLTETDGAFEISEFHLFHNRALEAAGDAAKALAHLDAKDAQIVDRRAFLDARARLLMQLNRHDEAKPLLARLVARNPDDKAAVDADFAAHGVAPRDAATGELTSFSPDAKARFLARCATLRDQYPTSQVLRFYALDHLDGPALDDALEALLRAAFTKGVPSIFVSLKAYLARPSHRAAIERVVQTIAATDAPAASDATPAPSATESTEATVPPAVWCLYFQAQLYDALGDRRQALATIDAAVARSPKLVELHMKRARILKHQGALADAAKAMDHARSLDLRDRYVNNKAAKYLLRCGEELAACQKGDATATATTKEVFRPMEPLTSYQCSWFALAQARRAHAAGDLGHALRHCEKVRTSFREMHDDQFDFHGYMLRKYALRAYLDMIAQEDALYGHKYYQQAASLAVDISLDLYD